MGKQYQFDAYRAQERLRERYASFLLDMFGVRHEPILSMLRENWTQRSVSKDHLFAPMLVQGAFPFKPGFTPSELEASSVGQRSEERPLHPKTVKLLAAAGIDYRLYEHQVDAIRAAGRGDTVVISAGTGSGKTEAFLIPIIDRLFWDQEEGRDNLSEPGVRALIVYPLNALVNNQVDRLLELLKSQEDITFAFYTSRLQETYSAAKNSYLNQGRDVPGACQIIDRKTLRGLDDKLNGRRSGPPHILVTNFAMLEYMLIRPLDRTIFLPEHLRYKGEHARLKMIVLDEAHVYAGAQADEIHMLLRRAAQRFGTELKDVQGFATSATLSAGAEGGEGENPLKVYAAGMFSKAPDEVAAIVGERYLPQHALGSEKVAGTSLRDPVTINSDAPLIDPGLRTLDYDEKGSLRGFVRDRGMADLAIEACELLGLLGAGGELFEGMRVEDRECPALVLLHVFAHHEVMRDLRAWLFKMEAERLPSLDEVAKRLYPKASEYCEQHLRAAEAVLRLGSLARTSPWELPYIPVRMHAMVRAPQGVWVEVNRGVGDDVLEGWPWGRFQSIPPMDSKALVSTGELLLCTHCSAPYLKVYKKEDRWGETSYHTFEQEDGQAVVFWEAEGEAEGVTELPAAWGSKRVDMRYAVAEKKVGGDWKVEACRVCKQSNASLQALSFSPRAALGALVDAIYPFLGDFPSADSEGLSGRGRRLLTFSDSRQEAARIAAQVEDTHDVGVKRQILYRVLSRDDAVEGRDFVRDLSDSHFLRERSEWAELDFRDEDLREDLARASIMDEFSRLPMKSNTLETLGLVEVVYPRLPPKPDEIYFIENDEWESLLSIVVDDLRRRGAVQRIMLSQAGRDTDLAERFIKGRNNIAVWSKAGDVDEEEEEPSSDNHFAFLPTEANRKEKNRLYQIAARLIERCDAGGVWDAERLLRVCWDALMGKRQKWLKVQYDQPANYGDGFLIDLDHVEFKAHDRPGYIDPVSGRTYFRNLRGIVPEVDNDGTLRELTDDELGAWQERHAVKRVLDEDILGLWTVEHTAQLDVDRLDQQERDFREGKRNLLASSTTMEMGIDLGGLTFVFLTNVPPGPANYWQRAGRAGRRADGSSMVLTLALARPHDQKVFSNPHAFLHDKIVPPRVRLKMMPLLYRHVRAMFLTYFFEEVTERDSMGDPMRAFGSLDDFMFLKANEGKVGLKKKAVEDYGLSLEDDAAEAFGAWLSRVNEEEHSDLAGVIARLVAGTALESMGFRALANDCAESFGKAVTSAREDVGYIGEQRNREEIKGVGAQDEQFLRALDYQERILKSESVISYLAGQDFLPRFGFPLSVVKLDIKWEFSSKNKRTGTTGNTAKREVLPGNSLRMERSLDMALSEYAPGAQVIANKELHTVAGVIPNWHQADGAKVHVRYYVECLKCGFTDDRARRMTNCRMCEHPTVEAEDFGQDAAAGEKQRRKGGDEDMISRSSPGPSPIRYYLEPQGFAVQLGKKPERVSHTRKTMPPAKIRLAEHIDQSMQEAVPGLLACGFFANERAFIRSEGQEDSATGQGYGFVICKQCGFSAPEESWDERYPDAFRLHDKLRGKGKCEYGNPWRHTILGTSMPVDVFRLRLLGELAPSLRSEHEEDFYLTLSTVILQVAAERLRVDSRTLHALVGTYRPDDGARGFGREVVLYEESGSGMLEQLCADPTGLLLSAIELLERGPDIDFIRFDTQFLASQGKLRLDLVREHFLDPSRDGLLKGENYFETYGMSTLQSAGLKVASIRAAKAWSDPLCLEASALAEDSFAPGSLMRAVEARITQHPESPTRLLLHRLPFQSADQSDEAFIARRVENLVEQGVEVRVLPTEFAGAVQWPILYQHGLGKKGLSTMMTAGPASESSGNGPLVFSQEWFEGGVGVSATDVRAKLAWDEFESRWEKARVVQQSDLRVGFEQSDMKFVLVPAGESKQEFTDITEFLAKTCELGKLSELGAVTRVMYLDRYVSHRVIPMWNLRKLLQGFRYEAGAKGVVITLEDNNAPRSYRNLPADQLYRTTKPKDGLSDSIRDVLQNDIVEKCKLNGLDLNFDIQPGYQTPHTRKLLVKFAPGSVLQTLKVTFDHGLAWMTPAVGSRTHWTAGALQTEHCEVYVIRNPDLQKETDARGKLGLWEHHFSK